MVWNWQLPAWPKFSYQTDQTSLLEREFLVQLGSAFAYIKNIVEEERLQFIVEILSLEGLKSSKIEGEILERESLQSSIRQHFGFHEKLPRQRGKETGMAALLCNVYETFEKPLTHEMLWEWHSMLFKNWSDLEDCGKYRTHPEPMQIVSHRLDSHQVFFEAPPSEIVYEEMSKFITWYNSPNSSEPMLGRAAIAHVYFESIHPFEDGNGRIGRILVEKMLSQNMKQPILIAVSKTIEKQKKSYYAELGKCNKTLEVEDWVKFFAKLILEAQKHAVHLLHFLIEKAKMLTALSGQINPRQEKVLIRMFAEGPDGFAGGLSAENYIAITKTSRATATRDLTDLVQKGALIKTGDLRHTRYWLNIYS